MVHPAQPTLKRALGVPLLVFYGLGVTVGAGIFALIGEILAIAGDHAPLAFLIAGAIAAATARTYVILSRRYPKAAGEAVYANEGFGPLAGRLAGIGVALTGIISSGVITLAFAGYVGTLTGLPQPLLVVALLVILAAVAAYGVKESLALTAVITLLEVGTLTVIAAVGLPSLAGDGELVARLARLPADRAALDLTMAAAAVAFFAFIGFEDIVNMAEEAKEPERMLAPAIAVTLAVTILLYVVIVAIAAAAPDRAAIATSDAPLADLFAGLTGLPATPISLIAAIAMINGILVQMVMASRVIYGMANEGLLPAWLGAIAPARRTPMRATVLVTLLIAALAFAAPMLRLAQATGYVTLAVFALINLSLFRLAARADWPGKRSARWWGALGAVLAAGLLLYEAQRHIAGG